MKITSKFKLIAAVVCLVPGFAWSQESRQEPEKKIERSELPLAVQKTVAEEKGGFSVIGFEQETENGQTVYEAKLRIPGGFHKTDKSLTIDANGSVIEVEEWISKYALPKAVLQGLSAQAANGKIVNFKEIARNGQLIGYEAKVMKDGKKSKVKVGPDGKPLGREE